MFYLYFAYVCAAVTIAISIAIPIYLFAGNRQALSILVDQHKIRFSLISGVVRLVLAASALAYMWWHAHDSISPSYVCLSILWVWLLASGAERVFHKSELEHAPWWYIGERIGDRGERPRRNSRQQIRLSGIFATTLAIGVVCAIAAHQVSKIRYRQQCLATLARHKDPDRHRVTAFTDPDSMTDETLTFLSGLPETTHLDLGSTRITNATLQVVGKLPNLTSLNLSNTSVDDDGLAHLRTCTKLRNLHLRNTNVTGRGFPISNAYPIGFLHLDGCPIDLAGLQCIKQQRRFIRLSLTDTPLDDSAVPLLGEIGCRALDLRGSNISKQGLKALWKTHRLPGVSRADLE